MIFNLEAQTPGILIKNPHLIRALKKEAKLDAYRAFARQFPNGQLGHVLVDFFNSLTKKETQQLVQRFKNTTQLKDLTPALYQRTDTIWYRMFQLATRGVGKGEILIVWLVKGATMNGGTTSYDINLNGQKYEVKDWSLQGSTSILAGVKSKVTNFNFWHQIMRTLFEINDLTTLAMQCRQYLPTQLITIMRAIQKRKATILSGECNKSDLKNLTQFYHMTHQLYHTSQQYTQLIASGPNQQPITIKISDLSVEIQEQLNLAAYADAYTQLMTQLNKLMYVQQPSRLSQDMQDAVNAITHDITYIIFRTHQIHISQAFYPTHITMSSLKFKEIEV